MLRFGRSSGMLRSLAVCRRRISNKPSVNSASPMVDQTISASPPLPLLSPPSESPLLPLPLSESEVETLEARLMYPFRNRKVLEEALIHSSYPNRRGRSSLTGRSSPRSYMALMKAGESSFLDTILDLQSSFPLLQLLQINISPHKIARTALRLGLYDFFRRDSPKLDQRVQQFVREQEGKVLYSGIPPKVPNVLLNMVYAMMGAILVDCGYDHAKAWDVMKLHLHPVFSWCDIEDSVATLRDICKDHHMSLEFKSKLGQLNITKARVLINGRLRGSAGWIVKSDAEGLAALHALNDLPNYMLPEKMLPILYPTADGSLWPLLERDDSQANIQTTGMPQSFSDLLHLWEACKSCLSSDRVPEFIILPLFNSVEARSSQLLVRILEVCF